PVVLELPEEHLKYLSRAANILKSKCGQMYSFRTLFKKSQEEMDAILAANSIRADAVLKIQKKAR
ncbi:MAG: hypothetical protein FWE17_01355, partial [Alphaproteobacteria bacterium]|nr:hypothetical protein [Alphaproteobacteria bacterium]